MSVVLFLALVASEPDAVVSTAQPGRSAPPPAVAVASQDPDSLSPHGLTTAQQIDRWLTPPPSADARDDRAPGWIEADERRVQGEIVLGFGTGGYRSAYGTVSAPLGEDGFISVTYGDQRGGHPGIPWR